MGDVPELSVSHRRALAGGLVVLVALLLAGRHLAQVGTSRAGEEPAARITAAKPAPRARLTVHVVGAVRRPGLYRLVDGTRVADAVERAGGATAKAELALINLAAPLADGAQIVVPARLASARAGPAAAQAPGAKVSLSRATEQELDALPGIGPTTAQKILDYRQEHGAIASVDELDAVPGIGPARLEQLRELVTP
jgi:competence protein ComEA